MLQGKSHMEATTVSEWHEPHIAAPRVSFRTHREREYMLSEGKSSSMNTTAKVMLEIVPSRHSWQIAGDRVREAVTVYDTTSDRAKAHGVFGHMHEAQLIVEESQGKKLLTYLLHPTDQSISDER